MTRTAATVRYIAFLRGINVGGHRVKMGSLRDLFSTLGFADVSTFIASGNVLFSAPAGDPVALERTIEARLGESLGYAVDTFVRTPAELASIIDFRPFPAEPTESSGQTLHVVFLRDALSEEALQALPAFETSMDHFRAEGRELYWHCRGKISESLVNWRTLTKAIGMSSTMRNLTMLRRLAALCPPA